MMRYRPGRLTWMGCGSVVRRYSNGVTFGAIIALTIGSGALGALLPQPISDAAATGLPVAAPLHRLSNQSVFPVLGEELHSPGGGDIGRVIEVLVDGWGQPRAAVVEFGGFLGVGSRKVAIDWRALRFYAAGQRKLLVADLAPDQLKGVPQYDPRGRPIIVVSPPRTAVGALAPESGL